MKRIPSLDGLRAISILLVICGHLAWRHHGPDWLAVYGNTGVRIFFVISGFLITTLLAREHGETGRISLSKFYVRRAYRILPAAAVFSCVACIIAWHQLRWYDLGAIAFYLVNFDPTSPWLVWHLWSLGVEEQFYLLWPGILKRWYPYRVKILLGVIVFSPICTIGGYYLKIRAGGYEMFPTVADNIAIGCLLALFADRLPKIKSWVAAVFLMLVVLIPQFPGSTPLRTVFMVAILWPVLHVSIAGLLLHAIRRPYKFLNSAAIVWVGKISYSLYLWQQPFCSNPVPKPLFYAVSMTFLLGILSYYLVERPLLRVRERERLPSYTPEPCAVPAGD